MKNRPWFNRLLTKAVIMIGMAGAVAPAYAHFQMIIPSDEIVSAGESRQLDLTLLFTHPFEGMGLNMKKPKRFGVWVAGKEIDLLDSLQETHYQDRAGDTLSAYQTRYKIRKPGDHLFFVEPQPYWEAAEERFIIHYTKTVVNAFGMEEGWDHELGLKAEIVPLTRPYGLWTNNMFRGIVKHNGKPVPFARVEVEYYNDEGKVTAPADPFITQIVKADANGVFAYAMPQSGWWGMAALVESEEAMSHNGKDYPVELGAVLWIKTHDIKK
ncbi:MAG TPA: DUF4198 domain-containing protein [Candidatus Tenderia electrophaga]|uniref:DUF4198 domain-containing protein n=1 Tax=Candidatus Tenderia electrophaga TaxID=1748243 RepID=A0A832J5D3_9GAMM|nr:DUF4198 domain-containing protein [Candidatus Tenderia electrophaga]